MDNFGRGRTRRESAYNLRNRNSPRRGQDGPRRSSRPRGRGAWLLHVDMSHERPSRWAVIMGLFLVVLALGVARLVDYDIVNAETYRSRADEYRLTTQALYAKRGTIYDRNGNVLAMSVECQNVCARPALVEDKDKTAEQLAELLGMEKTEVSQLLSSESPFVYIKRQVDQDVADQIEELGLAGIELEQAMKRVYPYGNLASQVIGVVNTENEGLTGIELQYDDVLTGENGSVVREHALDGGALAGGAYEETPARDGTDIVLTIDVNVQQAAEEALATAVESSEAETGSVVVVDPTSGEILAACSNPTYDPSDLANASSSDMNLRVVTDAYEPGSTFKVLTTSMALESGVLTGSSKIEVPARVKVGDDYVSDDDGRGETMSMTLREILRRSSNAGAALVGEAVGADDFADYLTAFGIGSSTGIDFPGEVTGMVTAREDYTGASVGAMSFGQAISIPPVQLARAVAAVANGGVANTPHFLMAKGGESVDWSDGATEIMSADTASQVADMMQTVVDEGTGRSAAIDGYDVAGKTGTGERVDQDGGYQQGLYMSSFIGFAPTEDAQVLAYVCLDGTPYHGGDFAAPAFKTIAEQALKTLNVAPTRSSSASTD